MFRNELFYVTDPWMIKWDKIGRWSDPAARAIHTSRKLWESWGADLISTEDYFAAAAKRQELSRPSDWYFKASPASMSLEGWGPLLLSFAFLSKEFGKEISAGEQSSKWWQSCTLGLKNGPLAGRNHTTLAVALLRVGELVNHAASAFNQNRQTMGEGGIAKKSAASLLFVVSLSLPPYILRKFSHCGSIVPGDNSGLNSGN